MAADKESQLYKKPSYGWRIMLAAFIALMTGLISIYSLSRYLSHVQTPPPVKAPKAAIKRVAVTALGRIQPQGEVTKLFPPSSLSGVRVQKLLVKEGDPIRVGEVVAWLEGYARSQAALQQAVDKVQISQTRLAQVKAGAKTGDINAQKAAITRLEAQLQGDVASQQATIARLQTELDNAQTENNRYQQIYKEGGISASTADTKRLQMRTVEQQITEAKASLNRTINTTNNQIQQEKAKLVSLQEIRPVDIQFAEADLKSALTAVNQAKADYDLTTLRSPINGKVLKVHTKTGEVNTSEGIIDIGKTSQMMVMAEVYQTDISKVHVGQKATITSTAFPGKIAGTVTKIGLQVDRQNILSVNPTAETDGRIVQVKIRIDKPADSRQVANLTNLQVDVAIHVQ